MERKGEKDLALRYTLRTNITRCYISISTDLFRRIRKSTINSFYRIARMAPPQLTALVSRGGDLILVPYFSFRPPSSIFIIISFFTQQAESGCTLFHYFISFVINRLDIWRRFVLFSPFQKSIK